MPLTVIVTPLVSLAKKHIEQWYEDHPGYVVVSSLEELYQVEPGLFSEETSIVLSMESMKIGDVRDLVERIEFNILLRLDTPLRGKIPDGVEYHDLSVPSAGSQLVRYIVDNFKGISRQDAYSIVEKSGSGKSAVRMSEQYALTGYDKKYLTYLFDPFPSDLPPWGITNAVIAGNGREALRNVDASLVHGSKSTDLMFQLVGYFKKVVISGSRVQDEIDSSKIQFFARNHAKITDIHGLISDMEYYPEKILHHRQFSDLLLKSMILSMSTRFSSRKPS